MKAQQAQTMQTTEGDTSLLEEILADAHAAGKDTSVLTRDERSALLVGLALSSIAVGLLAGFLWLAGSRERHAESDEEWSHGEEDDPAAPASQRRMAA